MQPITVHKKPGDIRDFSIFFFNPVARWGGVFNNTPRPLYLRQRDPVPIIQGRFGRVRKISTPPGVDPRTDHPVANRYTDWTVPAHMWMWLQQVTEGVMRLRSVRCPKCSCYGVVTRQELCFSPCFQDRVWDTIFLISGWSGRTVSMTKHLHLVYSKLVYVSISQPFWAETQIGPIVLARGLRGKK